MRHRPYRHGRHRPAIHVLLLCRLSLLKRGIGGSTGETRLRRLVIQRDDVIAKLRAHEADLHQVGVARLYLFGSVARQEARPDSDVDLFFDTDNPRFNLIELVDVQDRVSDILGTGTDVMTRASLHPMLRDRIEAEALRVF
jgi:predicted nucleotidyltransferase